MAGLTVGFLMLGTGAYYLYSMTRKQNNALLKAEAQMNNGIYVAPPNKFDYTHFRNPEQCILFSSPAEEWLNPNIPDVGGAALIKFEGQSRGVFGIPRTFFHPSGGPSSSLITPVYRTRCFDL